MGNRPSVSHLFQTIPPEADLQRELPLIDSFEIVSKLEQK